MLQHCQLRGLQRVQTTQDEMLTCRYVSCCVVDFARCGGSTWNNVIPEQSKAKQNSPPPRKQAVVENSKPAATGTIVVRSRNWRRPGPASKVAGISSSVSGTKNKAVQRPRSAAKTPRSATQPLMDHTDIAEADHSRKRKRKVVVQDEDESSNSDDGSSAAEPRRSATQPFDRSAGQRVS
jgi:hypothetical protein